MKIKKLFGIEAFPSEYARLQRERDLYEMGAFASGVLGLSLVYLGVETDRWNLPIASGVMLLGIGALCVASDMDARNRQNRILQDEIYDIDDMDEFFGPPGGNHNH